ncbi:MAG: M23 family metallopeptidase [Candidatus Rokubacteria bacterium]|nr:M23 family metallopeptidase [Candidatus Rokubacteria bacterium]
MKEEDRVHVVVERGDGSRILRVPVPPWWVVSATLGALGLGCLALLAFWGDYTVLRQHRAEFTGLQTRVADQERVIEDFEGRVRAIRRELETWTDLQARLWQPFGPNPEATSGPLSRPAGVGGGTAIRHLAPVPPVVATANELDRLLGLVTETGESLRALEAIVSRMGRLLASLPSRWPVRGPVNSDFGSRPSPFGVGGEFHSGIDIAAPRGTPVIAPAAGAVVFAGYQPQYGYTLIIDHGNDLRSLYGHLTKVLVAVDEKVERGQTVALVGSTGRSTGPHLHYEIHVEGSPVNPRTYLWD